MRTRPVYAVDDPVLAASLRNRLPLWEPGGELQQFRSLLDPLRVVEIETSAAQVIEPDLAVEDQESTDRFRSALQQLQEDLIRNDPQLAKGIEMPWDHIGTFSVHVHPSLSLQVLTGPNDADVAYQCKVMAKVDMDRGMIFVRSPEALSRMDAGGRAIATLFQGNPRNLAQAWLAACDRADAGRQARLIELAEERAEQEKDQIESDIARRTEELQQRTTARHRVRSGIHGNGTIPATRRLRSIAGKTPTRTRVQVFAAC